VVIIISVSDRKLLEKGKDAEEKRGSNAGAPLFFSTILFPNFL